MTTYTDILFEEKAGVARISINRPDKYNAFRGRTCDELIDALHRAAWNKSVGVVVLTGVGDKAFCTGGDQSAHDGGYDGRGLIGLPVEELQGLIPGAQAGDRARQRLCHRRRQRAGDLLRSCDRLRDGACFHGLRGLAAPDGQRLPPQRELSLRVFEKAATGWRVAAFHNTVVRSFVPPTVQQAK